MAHLYKSRLQNYAQKRSISFPTYAWEMQGPPHARLFKARVTIDGDTYEGPEFCTTLKDAEHAAAKVAFLSLSPDGTQEDDCLYKSLLQELAQKKGLLLPIYATNRNGPPHMSSFASTVQIAGECFEGQEARTKKQAEMNAAKVAYTALTEGGPRTNNAAVFSDIPMVGASDFGSSSFQTVPAVKKEATLISTTSKMQTTIIDQGSYSVVKETGKAKGPYWMTTPGEDIEKNTLTMPPVVIHQSQPKATTNVVDAVKTNIRRESLLTQAGQAHEGPSWMNTTPGEDIEKNTVTMPPVVIRQPQPKTTTNVVDAVKTNIRRENLLTQAGQAHAGSCSDAKKDKRNQSSSVNDDTSNSLMDSGAARPPSTKIVIRPHVAGMTYDGPIRVSDDEWVAMEVFVEDER